MYSTGVQYSLVILSNFRLDLTQNFHLTVKPKTFWESLFNFAFQDPPNVARGRYVNVYIGHSNGNHVGTNPDNLPLLNLANIVRENIILSSI